MKPPLKNYKATNEVNTFIELWKALNRNKLIYLQGLNKVMSTKFMIKWRISTLEKYLKQGIFEVVSKRDIQKQRITRAITLNT